MDRIAGVNKSGNSQIKVSGHTDDVPLIFGSNYRDNWDLAAARSASVVQAFAKMAPFLRSGLKQLALVSRGQLTVTIPLKAAPRTVA